MTRNKKHNYQLNYFVTYKNKSAQQLRSYNAVFPSCKGFVDFYLLGDARHTMVVTDIHMSRVIVEVAYRDDMLLHLHNKFSSSNESIDVKHIIGSN